MSSVWSGFTRGWGDMEASVKGGFAADDDDGELEETTRPSKIKPKEGHPFVVSGVTVQFPFETPYSPQRALMFKVIRALNTHTNALLESPTGTGKSAALLCSALAWQAQQKELAKNNNTEEQLEEKEHLLEQLMLEYFEVVTKGDPTDKETLRKATQQLHAMAAPSGTKQNKNKGKAKATVVSSSSSSSSSSSGVETDDFDSDGVGAARADESIQWRQLVVNMSIRYQRGELVKLSSLGDIGADEDDIENDSISSQEEMAIEVAPRAKPEPVQIEYETEEVPESPQDLFEDAETDGEDEGDDDDDFQQTPPNKTKEKRRAQAASAKRSVAERAHRQKLLHRDVMKLTSLIREEMRAAQQLRRQQQRGVPVIYYTSRTHSQIEQVIKELATTPYRPTMSLLGSRKHYCINPNAQRGARGAKLDVNTECRKLLEHQSCRYFGKSKSIANSTGFSRDMPLFDIEELSEYGSRHSACPYYISRERANVAEIVFCPYNYVLDPGIRSSLELDMKNAVVILDEAHNIEDVCRSSASAELDMALVSSVLVQLRSARKNAEEGEGAVGGDDLVDVYSKVITVMAAMEQWSNGLMEQMDNGKGTVEGSGNFRTVRFEYSGNLLRDLARSWTVDNHTISMHSSAAKDLLDANNELEMESPLKLDAGATSVVQSLFMVLKYMVDDNYKHLPDYRLVYVQSSKYDRKIQDKRHMYHAKFWCMNPAVVFAPLAEQTGSIVLASGTLSPMESFQSELGVRFEQRLEANHVINPDTQVLVRSVATANRIPLLGVYKQQKNLHFQDVVGMSLLFILQNTPHGVLFFLPSYSLLNTLYERWEQTGVLAKMQAVKQVFVEPRAADAETFEEVIADYSAAIRASVAAERAKSMHGDLAELTSRSRVRHKPRTSGALFMAVMRGKASEGIDFSDEHARAVVILSIPFPNYMDPQLRLKKEYNRMRHRADSNMLDGDAWYKLQAFRALNQAIGRCLRHSQDYGAIILLDQRYGEEHNQAGISKWVRPCIRHNHTVNETLQDLHQFFSRHKERERKERLAMVQAATSASTKEEPETESLVELVYTKPEPEVSTKVEEDRSGEEDDMQRSGEGDDMRQYFAQGQQKRKLEQLESARRFQEATQRGGEGSPHQTGRTDGNDVKRSRLC